MRFDTYSDLKRRVELGDPEAAWRALTEAIRRRDLDALKALANAALPEAVRRDDTKAIARIVLIVEGGPDGMARALDQSHVAQAGAPRHFDVEAFLHQLEPELEARADLWNAGLSHVRGWDNHAMQQAIRRLTARSAEAWSELMSDETECACYLLLDGMRRRDMLVDFWLQNASVARTVGILHTLAKSSPRKGKDYLAFTIGQPAPASCAAALSRARAVLSHLDEDDTASLHGLIQHYLNEPQTTFPQRCALHALIGDETSAAFDCANAWIEANTPSVAPGLYLLMTFEDPDVLELLRLRLLAFEERAISPHAYEIALGLNPSKAAPILEHLATEGNHRYAEDFARALALIASLDVAHTVAEWLHARRKSLSGLAHDWCIEHPSLAAIALAGYLQAQLSNGRMAKRCERVRGVLERLTTLRPDILRHLLPLFDSDTRARLDDTLRTLQPVDLPEFLVEAPSAPRPPDFWSDDDLPELLDHQHNPLPAYTARRLVLALCDGALREESFRGALSATIHPASLARWLGVLAELWWTRGQTDPDHDWIGTALIELCGGSGARVFASLLPEWCTTTTNPRQERVKAWCAMLEHSEAPEAVLEHVLAARLETDVPWARSLLGITLERVAMAHDLLVEQFLPDADLDGGPLLWGSRELKLDAQLKLVDARSGEPVGTLGASAGEDSDKARDSRRVLLAQRDGARVAEYLGARLHRGLRKRHLWRADRFREGFIENPLTRRFASGFVWLAHAEAEDGGSPRDAFIIDPGSGRLSTVENTDYTLDPECYVGLLHPAQLLPAEVHAWRTRLAARGCWPQACEQLARRAFRPRNTRLQSFATWGLRSNTVLRFLNEGWNPRGNAHNPYQPIEVLEKSAGPVLLQMTITPPLHRSWTWQRYRVSIRLASPHHPSAAHPVFFSELLHGLSWIIDRE